MPEVPDDIQVNLYRGLVIDNAYQFEPGVCILPVAEYPPTSPGQLANWSPVVVLRLHAPYRLRRAVYRSDKQTNPPILPSPSDTGAFVFMSGTTSLATGISMNNSDFDWSGVADYLFVEDCVSQPKDGLVLGLGPWQWLSSAINAQSVPITLPQTGAIAKAGLDALMGYAQGIVAGVNAVEGDQWWYNTASFYPGNLFDDTILNAGVTLAPPAPPVSPPPPP